MSEVTQSVRPPGGVDDIYRNTAKDYAFPPATVTPLKQRCSRISERAHEVEHCDLAASLVASSRPQRS